MEGLSGIHGPRDSKSQCGERKRNQENGQGHQQKIRCAQVHANKRRKHKEDEALDGGKRGAAQHFSQHDRRARDGSDQNRQQESFFTIFDHRHHGEDAGEQDNHDQRAGIKVIQVVLLTGGATRAERRSKT